ncbi:MAG: M20/M25/M40 family metallo-hydrolase [Bdellovibrionota bacterium]|nr:M20/M25/M40 family metallo-hydrolase [Deltaproteobacteria bacterium]
MIDAKTIENKITDHKTTLLQRYKEIVELPSVSSQPAHHKDILATAKLAASFIEAAGGETRIFETKGNPVVWGRIENNPSYPTIAIYNHLDVQPAEKGKDGWTQEPFTFVEKDGVFYSRGTTDDKGPAITALYGAIIAKELDIKTNVEFIWELEEEIGSPHFQDFLDQAKGISKANSIIVSDTVWLTPDQPSMTMSMRGSFFFEISLTTGGKDLHSGLCGGAARNPLAEIAGIINHCMNPKTGEILIEGIAESYEHPSEEILDQFEQSGFSVSYFKEAHQLQSLRFDDVRSITAHIWAKPTFEVHGIIGGYTGPGSKSIVPNTATAKISMRLVPGQDPYTIFELAKKHILTYCPDAHIELEPGMLKPFKATTGTPENKKIETSIEFGFGKKPVFAAEGGSIGAIVPMSETLQVPVYFMGLSLPEDSYHGPDESFRWRQIEGGIKAYVKYFELMGQPS